jgi:hypothetical protein
LIKRESEEGGRLLLELELGDKEGVGAGLETDLLSNFGQMLTRFKAN